MKMDMTIKKDSHVVEILTAQARHERVETDKAENAAKLITDLASDPNPHNRYMIAQLVGFTVNELIKPQTDWLNQIADVKNVAIGDRATFSVKKEGIKAFIQAKAATTARSKIAHAQVDLGTTAVSVRPTINFLELKSGRVQMSDLIVDATQQMEYAMIGYIQNVLVEAVQKWDAPYFATGTGLVKANLNPLIRHWQRYGGATLLGDIEVTSKLAEMTGFTATVNTQQYAESIIEEYNRSGVIGTYIGSKVVTIVNPYQEDGKTPLINAGILYILPTAADAAMRPLKVVHEGDVFSIEEQNIDDLTYEMRLDKLFGAGIVIGKNPTMSAYLDLSV